MKKITIFGRQISAVVLGLILMAALASAGLLSYYGMVTGTADVSQSVTLDGNQCTGGDYSECTVKGAWDASFVAPKTFIETHTLKNNADVPATIGFETTCNNSAGYDYTGAWANRIRTNNYIQWNNSGNDRCDGITTRYVEYFDDAGADFSGYVAPTTCDITVSSGQSIQTAIDDSDTTAGDVICVESGTYNENVNVDKDITLVSLDGQGLAIISPTSGNAITISSDDVTIKGFTITGAVYGIDIEGATGVTVKDNVIKDYSEEGIWINGGSVDILNNKIEASETPNPTYSVDSIYTKGGATVTVDHNTLKNNKYGPNAYRPSINDWSTSAGIAVHEGDTVTATNNLFDNNDFGIQVKNEGSSAETVTAHYNNFWNSNSVDFFYEKRNSDTSGTPFDATNNWWGTSGIDIAAGDSTGFIDVDSYIDADWMTKTDMTLNPGETDQFGIINEFNVALIPDSYTITTEVVPK